MGFTGLMDLTAEKRWSVEAVERYESDFSGFSTRES